MCDKADPAPAPKGEMRMEGRAVQSPKACYFDGSDGSQRVYAVYGNTNDYYMTLTRGWYKLDRLLESHLKQLGFQVVLFCDGSATLRCHDPEIAKRRRQLFPTKAEEKQDRAAEPTATNIVERAPTDAGSMKRRPRGKLSSRERAADVPSGTGAEASAPLEFECPVDALPIYLNRLMSSDSAKCAVVFSNAEFLFEGEAGSFGRQIRAWYNLKASNPNIAILLFQMPRLDGLSERLRGNSLWGFIYEHLFSDECRKKAVIHIGSPCLDEVFYLLNARVPDFRSADRLRALGLDESTVMAAAHRLVLQCGGRLYALKSFIDRHPRDCLDRLMEQYGADSDADALEILRNTEGWEEVARVVGRIIDKAVNEQQDLRALPFRESCFTNLRMARGAKISNCNANMCMVLKGRPGTGKSTAAEYIGRALRQKGLLPSGHFVKVERKDLVAGYVGHTALKTQAKIDEALGGVLLVDEAYELNRNGRGVDGTADFGIEAIETLMNAIIPLRGQICIIFAGYPERMDSFLAANDGLFSRIGNNIITIPDYDAGMLERIALRSIAKQNARYAATGSPIRFFISGTLGAPQDVEVREERYTPEALSERCREDRSENRALCPLSIYFDNLVADKDETNFGNAREANETAELLIANARNRVGARSRDIVITREDFAPDKQKYFKPRAANMGELLKGLDSIVGMETVKEKFRSLANLLSRGRIMNRFSSENAALAGQAFHPDSFFMIGNPGVGKTMIATRLAHMLCTAGLVRRYDPVRVQGNDLIGIFAAEHTEGIRNFLKKHNGSVVIVDEAHQLGQYSAGKGVLQALLDPMSGDDREMQVVFVFNCYPNQAGQLLGMESGIARRMRNAFFFEDYTCDEVHEIFRLKLADKGLLADDAALDEARRVLSDLRNQPARFWENGGSAERLLDKAFECMNDRIFGTADAEALLSAIERGEVSRSDLSTLTSDDIARGYARMLGELALIHPEALRS